jgi:hypothetical protein
MNPSISNKRVGVMDDDHWSNGRGVDDEDNDDAARGAGCSGDILATDLDLQLDGLFLTAAANHLFNPATVAGKAAAACRAQERRTEVRTKSGILKGGR